MNKEQLELLGEVYRKYADSHWTPPSNPKGKLLSDQLCSVVPMEHSKESFINKCKTNPDFSKKWGLKIEERELSVQERNEWFQIHRNGNNPLMKSDWKDFELDQQNIPTKLIKITYNDKTIESYA